MCSCATQTFSATGEPSAIRFLSTFKNGGPIVVPRLDFQMSARTDSVFLQKFQQFAVPFVHAADSVSRARLGFTEQALTLLLAVARDSSRPDRFREGRSLCARAL